MKWFNQIAAKFGYFVIHGVWILKLEIEISPKRKRSTKDTYRIISISIPKLATNCRDRSVKKAKETINPAIIP